MSSHTSKLIRTFVLTIAVAASWGECYAQFDRVDISFIEGYSQPRRVTNLATSTSGIIAELVADEGRLVQAGDPIVQLDSRVHQRLVEIARLRMEAQGELDAAQAELRVATQTLNIIQELKERGNATPDELMRSQSDYDLADANVRAVQEALQLRRAEFEKLLEESQDFTIKAPFDGYLVQYMKAEGEFVGVADPVVCVLADLSELSVEFIVQSKYRAQLAADSELEVHFVETGQRVRGRMYYISPFPDGETNTYTVKISVPNPNYELNAGERCQLELGPDGFRQPKGTHQASADAVEVHEVGSEGSSTERAGKFVSRTDAKRPGK